MATQGKCKQLRHGSHAPTMGWGPYSTPNAYQNGYGEWGVVEAWKWLCYIHYTTYCMQRFFKSYLWPPRASANASDMAHMLPQRDGVYYPCQTPSKMGMVSGG